jgi:hypothetical protein
MAFACSPIESIKVSISTEIKCGPVFLIDDSSIRGCTMHLAGEIRRGAMPNREQLPQAQDVAFYYPGHLWGEPDRQ